MTQRQPPEPRVAQLIMRQKPLGQQPKPLVARNKPRVKTGVPKKRNVNVAFDSIPRLFEGEKAFVIATGPQFNQETVDRIYDTDGYRFIGISDCYRLCPFVDFFYACDTRWWNVHYDKVMEWDGSRNGYWCTETASKAKWQDLKLITGSSGNGWSDKQDKIHYGSNSGFQITNIAYLLGIKTMILIGFNMMVVNKKSHFFGDHPEGLSRNSSYQSFASQFKTINYKQAGVTVINTANPTKLDHFPKLPLDEAIAWADENHG